MRRISVVLGIVLVAVFAGRVLAEEAAPDKAAEAVQKYLKGLLKVNIDTPGVTKFEDPVLQTTLPDFRFFVLRFAQYPVARMVPEGLGNINLFAVRVKGEEQTTLTLVAKAEDLQTFCAGVLTAKDEKTARTAAHAYAILRKELGQDGFFRFKIEPDKFEVAVKPGEITVKLKIEVDPGPRPTFRGNSGSIDCTIVFEGEKGTFKVTKEEQNLKAGMRPICQSLKLTDPDEKVRSQAEHDLLIMGVNALPYLREKAGETKGELQARIRALIRRIEAGEGGEHMPGGQPKAN